MTPAQLDAMQAQAQARISVLINVRGNAPP